MKKNLTLIGLLLLCYQLQAQVSFVLSTTLNVGSYADMATVADVNGDGKPDLINVNQYDDTITVSTNTGSGVFVTAGLYTVGSHPSWVTAADVNGDGKIDLITANNSGNTLSVLTNNGTGMFALAGTYIVGTNPSSVVAADVNGDGWADLICANWGNNTLTVLTNNGNGGFVLAATYGVGNNPWAVTVADVNGNGEIDLICANSGGNTLSVLTNYGSGMFALAGTYAVGANPVQVVASDVNGDELVDLICGNVIDNTLTVLTNNGKGGFVTSGTYGVGAFPVSVTIADVNGDGKPDLISANNHDNTLTILTNTGTGGFVLATTVFVGSPTCNVTSADINGDGKPDLISANGYSRTLSVFTNATAFPASTPTVTSQPQSQSITQGSPATLSVIAAGATPLSYQWLYYGTNVSGATNSTLSFPSVQLTNAGIYSVVVSNSYGSTNSANAVLQVLPPNAPSIQVNGALAVGTMTFTASVQVTVSGGFTGGYLFYTLDGSTPSFNSPLYSGPITLTNSATIQAMSLSSDLFSTALAPAVNVMIIPLYSLQTSVSGSGTITANPPTGPYLSNSVVTLTATPAATWAFDHWTGDASGSQNPLSVTMNGPRNIQAVFVPIPFYNLTTSVVGIGALSVDPPTGPYLSNSVVTVTATGSIAWPFDHWTGDASGSQNPLSVTMNGPLNITAVFVQNFPVTVSSPGGGSVTVNGQAIAPSTYYPIGSVQTLAATPNSGWTFMGWQGDASGTNNPLNITVNGTNNIEAIFGTVVTVNALGGGSIVLNQPNPIPYGTILTASAVPNSGKYFVSWGGAASGANAPTTITVTSANPTISALFTTLPGGDYSLSVIVSGNGSVGISPQQNYYSSGANVNLSATPVAGITAFYGWSLGTSGTNSPIIVTMSSNVVVQASFGSLPIVTVSPTNVVVEIGSNAVLIANALGIQPLTYQWQNSLGPITGATNATFAILNAQATNADNYSVVVSNPFGSVTSAVVNVTIAFPPTISAEPVSQTVAAGTPVALGITASGTSPLYYQWSKSSGQIVGATNSSFALNPAQTNDWDNYFVIVANAYGAVTSSITPLIVYGPVIIDSQPMSLVVPLYAPATFTVFAEGYPGPAYQWTCNGTNIPGATSHMLTVTNTDLANTGYYQALINNGYSTNNSYMASLNISPSLTLPFTGATAVWGTGATLSVGAEGSGTLTYQWYFNGQPISGATANVLQFSSIQFTNAGLYSVVVSSQYGSVTNAAYQVVVNPANVALGFYPGLTIGGVAGYSYIIQSSTNLADLNGWLTVTNLTLSQPTELWIDTSVDASSPFNPKTFYKILPGQ